jgi:peroxiredoxin
MTLNRILLGLMVVLFGAFLYVVIPTLDQVVIQAGDAAPSFKVKTADGRTFTEREFGGKTLVLNFWATWCAPCLEELPGLTRFAAAQREAGVVVLGISVDKNENLYQRFLASTRPNFPTYRDGEQEIPTKYGTFIFPETYVIRDGKVVQKIIGAIRDWDELEKTVKSL